MVLYVCILIGIIKYAVTCSFWIQTNRKSFYVLETYMLLHQKVEISQPHAVYCHSHTSLIGIYWTKYSIKKRTQTNHNSPTTCQFPFCSSYSCFLKSQFELCLFPFADKTLPSEKSVNFVRKVLITDQSIG